MGRIREFRRVSEASYDATNKGGQASATRIQNLILTVIAEQMVKQNDKLDRLYVNQLSQEIVE